MMVFSMVVMVTVLLIAAAPVIFIAAMALSMVMKPAMKAKITDSIQVVLPTAVLLTVRGPGLPAVIKKSMVTSSATVAARARPKWRVLRIVRLVMFAVKD